VEKEHPLSPVNEHLSEGDLQALAEGAGRIVEEIRKVIIGKEKVVRLAVVSLLCRGHLLIEDIPGVGKTMLGRALAGSIGGTFRRIQFTPDLLPADVTGTSIFNPKTAEFEFRPGPVFGNVLLADEVNRATPKTQSSLLECMEEQQVTRDGVTYPLPPLFFVVGTENTTESQGTFPLPLAQLDRFMFKLLVGYPTFEQEAEVLTRHHHGMNPNDIAAAGVRPVATAADLEQARLEVDRVQVEPVIIQYLVALCRATRETPAVQLGVSPRGAASLLHAAKAWAWLSGRDFVTPDEVKAVAKPCLRHRVILRPELELEGTTADVVLDGLLATVPTPR